MTFLTSIPLIILSSVVLVAHWLNWPTDNEIDIFISSTFAVSVV